jgi:hypothetical protein
MKKPVRICSVLIIVAACTMIMQGGPVVAYSNQPVVGNQAFGGTLGMDFTVNNSAGINVYSIGAFDSNQNGFTNPITISFYNLSNTASPVFSSSIGPGAGGTLVGGDRFYNLFTPLYLAPGTYSIVAQGFSASDPNENTLLTPTVNTGGGLISFVGTSRWGLSGFPTTPDHQAAQYGAGTFTFDAAAPFQGQDTSTVPEPASMALMGGGLVLIGICSRKFRQ